MTKLEWSKGYISDPARMLPDRGTAMPNTSAPKGSESQRTNTWSIAMKALDQAERQNKANARSILIDSRTLLAALGVSTKILKSKKQGIYLRRFVREGILLPNGFPNYDHPKVKQIVRQITGKKVR